MLLCGLLPDYLYAKHHQQNQTFFCIWESCWASCLALLGPKLAWVSLFFFLCVCVCVCVSNGLCFWLLMEPLEPHSLENLLDVWFIVSFVIVPSTCVQNTRLYRDFSYIMFNCHNIIFNHRSLPCLDACNFSLYSIFTLASGFPIFSQHVVLQRLTYPFIYLKLW